MAKYLNRVMAMFILALSVMLTAAKAEKSATREEAMASFREMGIGILVPNEKMVKERLKEYNALAAAPQSLVTLPLYTKANDGVPSPKKIGLFLRGRSEGMRYYYAILDKVETSVKSLRETYGFNPDKIPALVVYAQQGDAYKTSEGWVKESPSFSYQSWYEFYATYRNLINTLAPQRVCSTPSSCNEDGALGKSWDPSTDINLGLEVNAYDLYPVLVEGDYMLVIVDQSNSHKYYCETGKQVAPRGMIGWIKFMDDNRHPTVAEAYPLGCGNNNYAQP